MKETVTKVIDTLVQEDFHGAFQILLERYKYVAAGGDLLWRELEFHVCTINKSAHTKKSGSLFNDPRKNVQSGIKLNDSWSRFLIFSQFILEL